MCRQVGTWLNVLIMEGEVSFMRSSGILYTSAHSAVSVAVYSMTPLFVL